MIAKIVKGSGFREVTGYIIDSKKDARIIAHAGLFIEDVNTITKTFEAQAGMNPKVSRPVGHIALGFSKEDESRLTSRIMAEIALEYMKRMGIRNTQFFIARHFDKEHPHIHIAYNRIVKGNLSISYTDGCSVFINIQRTGCRCRRFVTTAAFKTGLIHVKPCRRRLYRSFWEPVIR